MPSTATEYEKPSAPPERSNGQPSLRAPRWWCARSEPHRRTTGIRCWRQQPSSAPSTEWALKAHQLVQDPHDDDHVLAAAARTINACATACAVLIEQIDIWAATQFAESRAGALHTETLGQLIDRLAIVWMRSHLLAEGGGSAVTKPTPAPQRWRDTCRAGSTTTRSGSMDEVLSLTLRNSVYQRLSYLDTLASNADLRSRAALADTEIARMTTAWRALLAEHEPDEHGRCPQCSGWRRRRGHPCSVWTTAHRHLITDDAPTTSGTGRLATAVTGRPSVAALGVS
ncbi:MAG: DUF4254 domain-containing protein [Pseudonocardiaceae bacterium]